MCVYKYDLPDSTATMMCFPNMERGDKNKDTLHSKYTMLLFLHATFSLIPNTDFVVNYKIFPRLFTFYKLTIQMLIFSMFFSLKRESNKNNTISCI